MLGCRAPAVAVRASAVGAAGAKHARECGATFAASHFAAGLAGISAISLRSFGRYSGYDASL